MVTGRELGLVAAGGALGAAARWAVGAPFDLARDAFPWTTLLVNLVGCLAIGAVSRRLVPGSLAWAFTVSGVLGGFTTMSLFAVELLDLLDAGRGAAAFAYLVLTLLGGTVAVLLPERGLRPAPAEGEP